MIENMLALTGSSAYSIAAYSFPAVSGPHPMGAECSPNPEQWPADGWRAVHWQKAVSAARQLGRYLGQSIPATESDALSRRSSRRVACVTVTMTAAVPSSRRGTSSDPVTGCTVQSVVISTAVSASARGHRTHTNRVSIATQCQHLLGG
jgi:hypothetical protein